MSDDDKVIEFPTSAKGRTGSKKQKNSGTKRKLSHPNKDRPYNETIANRICELIAEGISYPAIQNIEPEAPSWHTLARWRVESREFDKAYQIARKMQAERFVDQLIDIADNSKDAAMAAVRIKARQWVAAKRLPQVYGDAVRIDVEPETSLQMSSIEAARRIMFLMSQVNSPTIDGEVSENTGVVKLDHSEEAETTSISPDLQE